MISGIPSLLWNGAQEQALIDRLSARIGAYEAHMEAIEIRKAASALRAIWVEGNEYLQEAAPWATVKADPDRAAAQIRLALNLVRVHAVLSRPFIPDAAQAMLAAMRSDDTTWPDDVPAALDTLAPGHAFDVPDVLFAKITDAARDAWAARFAGTRG